MNRSFTKGAIGLMFTISALALSACAATGGPDGEDDTDGRRGNPIVNGQETNDYPGTGMLLQGNFSFCTGTLVAPRTVITAAHCVDGQDPKGFTFGFGPSQDQVEAQVGVVSAVQHPQWDSQNLVNDVAVLTLDQDAPVAPVAMNPSMDQSWIGKKVTLVGYGVTDGPSQTGGGTKRMVTVTVDKVEATTLGYTTTNGETACNGDSGGPAYLEEGGQLLVAGITSYGDQGCKQYGVYTRVDAYLDFIKEQIDLGGGGAVDPNDPGVNPNDPGIDPNDPGIDPNDPGIDPKDPCQGETYEGRCEGDVVIYCEDDQIYTEQCYGACDFDDYYGYYACM